MELIDGWFTEELAAKITESSAKLRRLYGWRHHTIPMEAGVVLDIDKKEFEKLTWPARVAIAEETKRIELLIKAEGIPCAIQVL